MIITCTEKYLPTKEAHISHFCSTSQNVCPSKPIRSNTITELRDILPTLLDFAGIPVPEGVDGFSLMPEIVGKPKEEQNNREYLHGEHSFHSGLSSHFIVTETDKYIWYSEKNTEQYFDLRKDPREEHNAIADEAYQARIAYLRALLIQELDGREEGYSDGHRLITGRPFRAVLSKVLSE